MIRNMFRFVIETAKKMPMWKKVLFAILVTTPPVVAKKVGQKVIDKLFKDRKKSLKQKLQEIKELWDEGHITEEEYQKIRKGPFEKPSSLNSGSSSCFGISRSIFSALTLRTPT